MNFKKLYIIILAFLSAQILLPQEYQLVESFGKFDQASSFSFLTNDKIVVADVRTNELILFENKIEVKRIGGFGWGHESFDKPIRVFSDPLNIFVADYNNHRVQRYDKNLNYIGTLYTRDDNDESKRFGFPMGIVQSSQGDLFVLDSENKRVVKFNSVGDYAMNFGGFDYGMFGLDQPIDMAIDDDNNIYILDQNKIKIFDSFGTGIKILVIENEAVSISIFKDVLTVNTPNKIYEYQLNVGAPTSKNISIASLTDDKISEVIVSGNYMFILTKKKIFIYEPKNNSRHY